MGKWGNGEERKRKLRAAGYDPGAVQTIVNALVDGDIALGEQQEQFAITGTETLKVEVDLTKYNSIELTFLDGGDNN